MYGTIDNLVHIGKFKVVFNLNVESRKFFDWEMQQNQAQT